VDITSQHGILSTGKPILRTKRRASGLLKLFVDGQRSGEGTSRPQAVPAGKGVPCLWIRLSGGSVTAEYKPPFALRDAQTRDRRLSGEHVERYEAAMRISLVKQ